jgi:hypothetical protein
VITAQRAAYHCCAALAIIGFWGDEVKSARFGDSRANQSPRGNRLIHNRLVVFFKGNLMKKLLTVASLSVAALVGCEKPASAPAPAPMAAPAPAPAPAPAEAPKDAAPMAAPDASKDQKK